MPDKSRRTTEARYRRKKAARQRLVERAAVATQPAQSEGTAKVTRTAASEMQASNTLRYSVGNELRKIGILGGSLIVILIVVSLILRYTMQ
jgi:preprotein translocase subunit SecF